VGQLGLDCRYCHNTVEKADFAAIPPTETCMNCHRSIWPKDVPGHDKLGPIRQSFATGLPVGKEGTTPGWRQVTTVPDYVYFNHAAHVNSGVSCVECHGQVNHMEVVYQAKPMNMAWCLECHRDPAARLRPRDKVTALDWVPSSEDASTVAVFANMPVHELEVRAYKAGVNIPNPNDPTILANLPRDQAMRTELARKYVAAVAQTESADMLKAELGKLLKDQYHINPNTDCITCHR